MDLIRFDPKKCSLCGACIKKCPFSALSMGANGVEVNANCKVCGVCLKECAFDAISFEQKAGNVDKKAWNNILVFAEQTESGFHPVVFELIGEAKRLADRVGYGYTVNTVSVGPKGTKEKTNELLCYDIENAYVYEHDGFQGFKADCYTDAIADCIATMKPSIVLIGGTEIGRSLAPRLSTRFHTGLTADCTSLDIKENTDLVQIRPAFGGDIMAEILISDSRPQFATVRYKVMDRAEKAVKPTGKIVVCTATDAMVRSRIEILENKPIPRNRSIEEEEILIVAGRGVKSQNDLEMLSALAKELDAGLCFTRPLVEMGWGDQSHQIGLSGRTVKPKVIITCGVSGAIQFASCMKNSEKIIAINSDETAPIFNIATHCLKGDLYEIIPSLLAQIKQRKEENYAKTI